MVSSVSLSSYDEYAIFWLTRSRYYCTLTSSIAATKQRIPLGCILWQTGITYLISTKRTRKLQSSEYKQCTNIINYTFVTKTGYKFQNKNNILKLNTNQILYLQNYSLVIVSKMQIPVQF